MNRAVFALGICVLGTLTSAHATADCTGASCADSPHQARSVPAPEAISEPAQRATEYLDLWVTRRVLFLRFGAQHPDVVATQTQLASLHRALPSRTPADDDAVLAWLRFAHADTEARLAEMGTRCGPQHIDLRGAEMRRDALWARRSLKARGSSAQCR